MTLEPPRAPNDMDDYGWPRLNLTAGVRFGARPPSERSSENGATMLKAVTTTKRVVLGIDAAWTTSEPSGVALAAETSGGWHLIAAEAPYAKHHSAGASRPRDEQRL